MFKSPNLSQSILDFCLQHDSSNCNNDIYAFRMFSLSIFKSVSVDPFWIYMSMASNLFSQSSFLFSIVPKSSLFHRLIQSFRYLNFYPSLKLRVPSIWHSFHHSLTRSEKMVTWSHMTSNQKREGPPRSSTPTKQNLGCDPNQNFAEHFGWWYWKGQPKRQRGGTCPNDSWRAPLDYSTMWIWPLLRYKSSKPWLDFFFFVRKQGNLLKGAKGTKSMRHAQPTTSSSSKRERTRKKKEKATTSGYIIKESQSKIQDQKGGRSRIYPTNTQSYILERVASMIIRCDFEESSNILLFRFSHTAQHNAAETTFHVDLPILLLAPHFWNSQHWSKLLIEFGWTQTTPKRDRK